MPKPETPRTCVYACVLVMLENASFLNCTELIDCSVALPAACVHLPTPRSHPTTPLAETNSHDTLPPTLVVTQTLACRRLLPHRRQCDSVYPRREPSRYLDAVHSKLLFLFAERLCFFNRRALCALKSDLT